MADQTNQAAPTKGPRFTIAGMQLSETSKGFYTASAQVSLWSKHDPVSTGLFQITATNVRAGEERAALKAEAEERVRQYAKLIEAASHDVDWLEGQ